VTSFYPNMDFRAGARGRMAKTFYAPGTSLRHLPATVDALPPSARLPFPLDSATIYPRAYMAAGRTE